MNLTAAVLTHNEAGFIGPCLASLRALTDDILVVDAFSTDGTVEASLMAGARVVERPWKGFAAARNTALELAADAEWVIFVDADERIPAGLVAEIRTQLETGPGLVDGYWISRRNVICGRIMRGGGWWPDYQLRLLRRRHCEYPVSRQVHEQAACEGPTLALNQSLLHLNYHSWREFGAKQFAFAALAAGDTVMPRRRAYLGAPGRTLVRRFLTERGYLDGVHGLVAAGLLSASEFHRIWLSRRRPL